MNSGSRNGEVSWMAFAPLESTAALAELRLILGETVEVALPPDPVPPAGRAGWWLRGRGNADAVVASLRRVAGARVFVEEAGKLVAAGETLPRGPVPAGLEWRPLRETLRPEAPDVLGEGEMLRFIAAAKIPVRLEAGGPVREAGLLLTSLEAFAAWVESAPEVRLRRLEFAASRDGRAAVRGNPLPDLLTARRYSLAEGVAVPCGWTWSPPVPAAVLAEALGVAPGAVALLHENGKREDLPAEAWVAAGRASARATLRNFQENTNGV